jgi:hypothetical protein
MEHTDCVPVERKSNSQDWQSLLQLHAVAFKKVNIPVALREQVTLSARSNLS